MSSHVCPQVSKGCHALFSLVVGHRDSQWSHHSAAELCPMTLDFVKAKAELTWLSRRPHSYRVTSCPTLKSSIN